MKWPLKALSILLLLLTTLSTYSQQANNWYFGWNAGLTFNTTPPTPILTSAMYAGEGCASISNDQGNILFYTNGVDVYDKNNQVMPNGSGLLGHISSSNSSIVIPDPGNPDHYYIFTADAVESNMANGYRYSIVDMTLNSGLGDITTKNVLLFAPSTEKLTATSHANGVDVWVITKEWHNDIFRAYKVGCNGVDPNPIISHAGKPYGLNGTKDDAVGCIKVSPDGTKIASPRITASGWEIFDFNNSTGVISNSLFIPLNLDRIFGVEFSPNSQLVYIATECCGASGSIHQYKVDIYDSATITNSQYRVDSSDFYKTALQLGPDNKIYNPNGADSSLNVINYPNTYGPGCGYVYKAINLGRTKLALRGLPGFYGKAINDRNVDFTYNPTADCSSVTFNGSTLLAAPVTWSWDFGDGTFGTGQSVSHTFPANSNSFNVILTVTNTNVCGTRGTKMKNINFNRLIPQADFSFTNTCGALTVNFNDATTITGGNISSWQWDFGDGNSSTQQNTSHIYAGFGQYNVRLIATSNDACQTKDTIFKQVILGPKPVAQFIFDKGCVNVPVQFTDQSTIVVNSITQWHWDFGDGNTSTAQHPQHSYNTAGVYPVSLVSVSNGGCGSDTLKIPITITNKPVAGFDFTNSCAGSLVNFTDNSSLSASAITGWYWNFGNNTTANTQNGATQYSTAGSYNVQHLVFSSGNCPSDTLTRSIIIEDKPLGDFQPVTTCGNISVNFQDISTSSAGAITNWYWDFGDGNTSAVQQPVHSYTGFGSYSVNFTATTQYGCQADTVYKTVIVPDKPLVNFTLPPVCLLDAFAAFTNATTIRDNSVLSYSWNFGDMNANPPGSDVSALTNPQYRYSAAATYAVKLVASSSFSCKDSVTRNITVNGAVPRADFRILNPAGLCSNATVSIKDSSTVDFGNISKLQIFWGDGNNTIENTPLQAPNGRIYSHLYPYFGSPATRTYTITLYSYSGAVCVSVLTRDITLYASPEIRFLPMNEVCHENTPFNITQASEIWGLTGIGTYSGTGIINNTTGSFDPAVADTGNHIITYSFITPQGCRADSSRTIRVNPTPASLFNFNAACLPSAQIQFTNQSGVPGYTPNQLQYNWNFSDPNANGSNPNTSTAINPLHIFTSLGSYPVNLSVTSPKGCVKDTSITLLPGINIYAQPVADFKLDSSKLFCQGTPVEFINISDSINKPLIKWWWDFGDGNVDSVQRRPAHLYAAPGIYTATLLVQNQNGCKSAPISNQIVIESIPVADFRFDTTCLGKPIQFSDHSINTFGNIITWRWDFADGNTSALQNPMHTYTTYNTYRVNLRAETQNGCVSSPVTKIIAINRVNIFAGRDTLAAANQPVQLQASGGRDYVWSPVTGLNNPVISNPIATLLQEQQYIVKGTTEVGCIGYDTVKVIVFAKVDIYVPTAFTPNGDGKNDLFKPVYAGIKELNQFVVFDRWGQLVFTTKDMGSGWDGRLSRKEQDTGVFVWIVRGVTYDGRVIEKKGTVTLIR